MTPMRYQNITVVAEALARVEIPVGHDTRGHVYRMAILNGDTVITMKCRPVGSVVVCDGDLSGLNRDLTTKFELEEDRRSILMGTVQILEKIIK